jgi:hypothetical protein
VREDAYLPPATPVFDTEPLLDLEIEWPETQEEYQAEILCGENAEIAQREQAAAQYPSWLEPDLADVTRPQSEPELIPVLAAKQIDEDVETAEQIAEATVSNYQQEATGKILRSIQDDKGTVCPPESNKENFSSVTKKSCQPVQDDSKKDFSIAKKPRKPRVPRSWTPNESIAGVLCSTRFIVLLGLVLTLEILIVGLIQDAGYTVNIL